MDLVIMSTKGPEHPTDASFPFFLARAAHQEGRTVAIVLATDSSPLAGEAARENVQGVGFPPLKELYQYAKDHEIPIYL